MSRDSSGTTKQVEVVNIDLQVNKVTSESTIEIWNQDHTQLLTQSCSTSLALKTGGLQATMKSVVPTTSMIAFDVDHDGFGTLTFGNQTYTVSGNPEVSGGIECNSIVSDTETLISCTVPEVLSPEVMLQLNTITTLAQRNKLVPPNCFPTSGPLEITEVARFATNQDGGPRVVSLAETGMRTSRQQLDLEAASLAGNETFTVEDNKHLEEEEEEEGPSKKRQYNPCSQWTPTTIREGDGDPHQTPKHIQVTESLDCGNGECSIGQVEVHSMTIRFTAGAKLSRWISAGFRVEQSTTTGSIKECRAGAYDWVAAWVKVGRTSYRVRNGLFNSCTGTKPQGDVFTITSPNANNNGGNPYCVRGKRYVRRLGDSWDEAPKPGLP
ncbi:hypothetical protein GE21DRAFT_5003 [Neurospora crassa]|uniref:Uncharacterized protein n=1 Tax=Neurospora crassa (strain ATCC 24698 / 74-OR23-1A / CBS 708.71 / DSM 1257 / FGSC 987) TaxID=367110 RepID=Q7S3M0_NEUCR|nr:hypothetical protein NCU08223 [Neurospora crassa OR74A]EAA30077.1 hypothetical protein NCU08223 [Neurospora crassa OR74A]KHE86471.1 hypothetical protein GE21DRAFT_5003 [Neurospora crassa]|eukprot:XP_959313.1 hypothetical protein NCU08223 [Neurospora crassa OR74A]